MVYYNIKNKEAKWIKIKRNINIGYDIDINEKNKVLNYLYTSIDINNFKYGFLKTIEDTNILKQYTYHVSLHFHGYNYILIIKNIISYIPEIYLVSKLELKNNYYNTKVYKLKCNYNLEEFNNTIIDGKLIYKNEDKIFLISDILYYKSIKLLTMKLIDKFKLIDLDIELINKYINIFTCKLIKIYNYSELYELIYNKIKDSEYKINGVIFFPIRTGKYYIYINDYEFDIIKNSPCITCTNNIILSNIEDIKERKLLLIKSDIIDVYNIYTLDKLNRLGIASVPSMEESHILRKYFENNNELIIECFYNNKFSKWQPIIKNIIS